MRRIVARIALCSLALIPVTVANAITPAPRTAPHVAEGGGVQPFASSTKLIAEGGGVQPFSSTTTGLSA